MKLISATSMRKNISEIISSVKYNDQIFGIGRRNKIEAVIMKYPENLNKNLSEIANINANSSSFDFLKNEPDVYSIKDLKKRYA